MERLAAFATVGDPVPARRRGSDGPLSLSFYQIDDYLTCPRRFQYAHVLRVPLAPHHALVYGSALHRAVQRFHEAQSRGEELSVADLDAVLDSAWVSEGFVSREHEEARLAAARAALRRFREDQLRPGAVVPTYVEREFSFILDGDRIRGRWDRVDVEALEPGSVTGATAGTTPAVVVPDGGPPTADVIHPTLEILGTERVTITDYKSSDVRDPVRARKRARESLQLQIYAMGYEAMTGRLPDAVALHFLDSGLVGTVPVDHKRLARARARISTAADGIRRRDYGAPPDPRACGWCPSRDICPASAAASRAGR